MTTTNPLLIGLAGLRAAQQGISTTSHNISNLSTDGYSRQRNDYVTTTPLLLGNSYFGTGVELDGVSRVIDQNIINDLRGTTSTFNELDTFLTKAQSLDNLLADNNTGLSPGLQSFFDSIQGLSTQASSIPSRQLLLSQGRLMADRFHKLYDQFSAQRTTINTELNESARRVTSLAKSIAQINLDIRNASASGFGGQPNDLLDRRDEYVRQLSELVGVSVLPQDDNTISVFTANGQALVLGDQSNALTTQVDPSDPNKLQFVLQAGNSTVVLGRSLTGGKIGGTLNFLNSALEPALNRLGLVAVGLADSFNTQHKNGIDLNGNLGTNFFTDINDPTVSTNRVVANTANSGTVTAISADIVDVAQLTDSDYELRFAAGAYTVTRLSDNQVVYNGAAAPGVIDGFQVNITGAPTNGDSFIIQPTKSFGSQIQSLLTSERQIAAASPIAGAVVAGNSGTGKIDSTTVNMTGPGTGILNGSLNPPLRVVFTSATTYEVQDLNNPAQVLATGTFTPNASNSIFVNNPPTTTVTPNPGVLASYGLTALSDLGYDITLTGAPANGDAFTFNYASANVGDNRNALALAKIQTTRLLDGGHSTLNEGYGVLLSEIGVKTSEAGISQSASQTLLRQVQARRESVSGVNLDEEAANLLKFQQAYSASAQVISVANQLFDTLLSSVR